jgi:hypothetical protein
MAELPAITVNAVDTMNVIELDPLSRYLIIVEMEKMPPPEATVELENRIKQCLNPLFKGIEFEVILTETPLYLNGYRFKPA